MIKKDTPPRVATAALSLLAGLVLTGSTHLLHRRS